MKVEDPCVICEASNLRLYMIRLFKSLRSKALSIKGFLSYSQKRKRTDKQLKQHPLKKFITAAAYQEDLSNESEDLIQANDKTVKTYAEELYTCLNFGNVCWHSLCGVSTNDHINIYERSNWTMHATIARLQRPWKPIQMNKGWKAHKSTNKFKNATKSQQGKARSQA